MANTNASALIVEPEQRVPHATNSNMNMLQPPTQQVLGSSDGPVAIFWDIQNCDVPKNVRPEDVGGNIRMALRVHPVIKGAVVGFSAYGDFNDLPRTLREGCQGTGVKLVDVPNGKKDAADKAILVDMFLFALDHPPPSSIMLISGDVDFAPALHVLGQRGYTVILVIPSGVRVSPALRNAGKFVLDWPSVAHGKSFVPYANSHRNLRIIPEQERKEYILYKPIPDEPAANAAWAIRDAFTKHSSDSIDVTCLMPGCMEADLQKQLMNMDAHTMIGHLNEVFQDNARTKRFNLVKELFSCKMLAGTSVSRHVLKMKDHLEHLARLGLDIQREMASDIVLQSLPNVYGGFIVNYNMHNMDKTVSELHEMLQTAEKNIKSKTKDVLMVNKGISFKKAGAKKGKTLKHVEGKGKTPKQKDDVCLNCNMTGHWKRNCKKYHDELKNISGASTSSVIFLTPKQKDDVCLYCNMTGHWKRNCKKYHDELKNISGASTFSGSQK